MKPDEYYEIHALIVSVIVSKRDCIDLTAGDLADEITAAIRDYFGAKSAEIMEATN